MRAINAILNRFRWSKKRYFVFILLLFLVVYLLSALFQALKPLPAGIDYQGPIQHGDIEFLSDRRLINDAGKLIEQQQIFDYMLSMVSQAKTTIVIDMFLFSAEMGQGKRDISQQLSEALINKKNKDPLVEIIVLVDPINSMYGGIKPLHFANLRKAGIEVKESNLVPLRASNPAWSGFWYMCCQAVGNNSDRGWLPNVFNGDKVTLRSYLNLLNFKANHRKTIVIDSDQGWKAMVSSANVHNASSSHANVAMVVSGAAALDVLKTEQAVGQFSDANIPFVVTGQMAAEPTLPKIQVLTEAAIKKAALKLINGASAKDQLDLMMFYLSDRDLIKALKQANSRGVGLRVLLDPNKDAFGRQKNGIPNVPVAAELVKAGVNVRWCDTHGEQCHSKMLIRRSSNGEQQTLLGSANYTSRNLDNLNLETNVLTVTQLDYPAAQAAFSYFEKNWSNLDGKISVEYSQYANSSKLKYLIYRLMEWSGVSTF